MVDLVIGSERSDVILHQLNQIRYRDHSPPSSLSYEDRLSDICADSVHVLDFVMEIEDYYDIVLGTHEMAEISTVSDLVELIEEKTK